jgi:hypothetical protein
MDHCAIRSGNIHARQEQQDYESSNRPPRLRRSINTTKSPEKISQSVAQTTPVSALWVSCSSLAQRAFSPVQQH